MQPTYHRSRPASLKAHRTTEELTGYFRDLGQQARDYDWLAAAFTRQGWTPEEMRAAEKVFGPAAPVADAMRMAER